MTCALRPPQQVMRLARMGAFHQSRLSFCRSLLRRFARERWRFERQRWEVDAQGVGVAVYLARGPHRSYSLVCFAHDLPAELRSDRVIANAWDATFTLHDGTVGQDDLLRLQANVPQQELGRISPKELSLSRANRSQRLFDYVVDCLASGRQPEEKRLDEVGYLMRTTAVYGSGKFGAADYQSIADREEFKAPFQAEMMSVYLTRIFQLDLVEHLARCRGPSQAVKLAPRLSKMLGIGNSTGLGMAPFLVKHPILLHSWILARETALARVRSVETTEPQQRQLFCSLLAASRVNATHWYSVDARQQQKITELNDDLALLVERTEGGVLTSRKPWDQLYRWAEQRLGLEAQELLVSLLLEPYGSLVDELSETMGSNEEFFVDGSETVASLLRSIEQYYFWALSLDWNCRDNIDKLWYISQEKLEPRLANRFEEQELQAYEQPLAYARDVALMCEQLLRAPPTAPLAVFLSDHPEHRHAVSRVQMTRRYRYGEIYDNTIGAALYPVDMLRCKLSFFGAGHFDPRSDRWVRINLFQHAPFPEQLDELADFWPYCAREQMLEMRPPG